MLLPPAGAAVVFFWPTIDGPQSHKPRQETRVAERLRALGKPTLRSARQTGGFQIRRNCWPQIRRQRVRPHNWPAHAAQTAHVSRPYRRQPKGSRRSSTVGLWIFFFFNLISFLFLVHQREVWTPAEVQTGFRVVWLPSHWP